MPRLDQAVGGQRFSAAARRLNLTQPAVSLQIRELEGRIGLPLVERMGKHAFTAAAGEELIEQELVIFISAATDVLQRIGRNEIDLGLVTLPVNERVFPSRVLGADHASVPTRRYARPLPRHWPASLSRVAAAPQIHKNHLPADFDRLRGDVEVDKIVFLDVAVADEDQLKEAQFACELAAADPRIQAIVAAAQVERGAAVEDELGRLAPIELLRGIRRLIQNKPDPDFCIQPGFVEGVQRLAGTGCISRSASTITNSAPRSSWPVNARTCP
jgi:DNA-binding transcriptional LysR family regulator